MGTVLLFVVFVLALVFARVSMLRISDITEDDIRWIQHVGTTDSSVFTLIQRYLYRLRIHRWVGAGLGAVMAVVLSQGSGVRTTAGIGAQAPWADVLFGALFGLLVCSLLAETNRVIPSLVRGAEDDSVPSTRIDNTFLQPLSWVFVLASVILAALNGSGLATALAGISVVSAAAYGIFLAVIRGGHRPLMPLDIRHADDALRQYAARRFALEAVAMAVLLSGWGFATTVLSGRVWGGLLVFVTLIVTFLLVGQSRPYPARTDQ